MIRRWWRMRVRRRDLEPGPPLPPEVEDRIWAEVQRRIALGEAGRPQLAPLPDRRPLILSIALVVCALLTTGILAAQRPGPKQPVATADTVTSSALTMADLARVARTRSASRLDDGDVLSLTIDRLPSATQRARDIVGWREVHEVSADGRGEVRIGPLPEAPGSIPTSENPYDRPGSLTVAGLTPAEIAALPSDREDLLASLEHRGSTGGYLPAAVPFQLLATPLLSGATRATLFHLLDDLGAKVGDATTDASDRPGVIVILGARGNEPGVQAVVDPTTSTILSLRRSSPETLDFDPAIALYQSAAVGPPA